MHFFFDCIVLEVPPALKVEDLSLRELPIFILSQSLDHRWQDMRDPLIVILIRCVEPADIVMRVADHVEIEWIFIVFNTLRACRLFWRRLGGLLHDYRSRILAILKEFDISFKGITIKLVRFLPDSIFLLAHPRLDNRYLLRGLLPLRLLNALVGIGVRLPWLPN